jgi:16S rRNA (uracil1498-N3)-methyltransferase
MRRFYFPEIPEGSKFVLSEEESKHIVRVLRMEAGDELVLLDGKGLVVTAAITDPHPKRCEVEVRERIVRERPAKEFHLAIAPTKNLDRMEWMVEKIVEIGCTRLSFIHCDRSERVNLKYDRLVRVAVSAMKQAQHDFLLRIDEIAGAREFIAANPNGAIAHCMDGEKLSVGKAAARGPVLIGPEGDFSPEELKLALENGYKAVHLGESRLRTETAGLVATVLSVTASDQ